MQPAFALVAAASALVAGTAGAAAPPNPGPGFSNVSNESPAWSPDGRSVVFMSYAAGHAQLFVVDAGGRRVRRLTHDSASDYSAQWLRDGRVVFHGQRRGGDFVGTVDRRGRTVVLKVPPTSVFSPDGRRIAYDVPAATDFARNELWVADADGSNARLLVGNADADGAQPAWSPDGTRIAYVGGNGTGGRTIHVIGADGSGDVEITHDGNEWSPTWSPDGRTIAYATGPADDTYYQLRIVNAAGSGDRAVKPSSAADTDPAWSPDGKWLAFASDRRGRDDIWLVTPNGSELRRLTFGGCTIVGTNGPDVLVGTPGRDVICGFGGDDVLRGLGGDDTLLGGTGNDRIFGGVGNDRIFGEQGDDTLVAGPGIDRLAGGPGVDTAFADRHDSLYSIEHRHGGRVVPPVVRATPAAIERAAREAVREAKARVAALRVSPPAFSLTVAVPDPAAFLRHRSAGLVSTVYDKRILPDPRFQDVDYFVRSGSHVVFSVRITAIQGGTEESWYVRPDLTQCAEHAGFDLELDPDGAAPPCRAP